MVTIIRYRSFHTLFFSLVLAPLSKNNATISNFPFLDARCSGASPYYLNRQQISCMITEFINILKYGTYYILSMDVGSFINEQFSHVYISFLRYIMQWSVSVLYETNCVEIKGC